jgi:hypothetical protein
MENHHTTDAKKEYPRHQEPQVWEMDEANPKPADYCPQSPKKKWYIKVRWNEVIELVGVIIGLAVCYIYWKQLDVMGRQLIEIQGSSSQTSQLIVNAAHQAGETHDLAVAAGKQADASKALADLTAKQFDASQRLIESQRASISVTLGLVLNPITFHDRTLSIAFSMIMKNNGRLPANKVKVRYGAYFSQWGKNIFSEPMERQRDFCSKPNTSGDSRTNLRGLTNADALSIIPGDMKEWQINFGMGWPTDSDIIEWPPPETHQPQTKRVYPIVIGCVDYQSGVMTEPHQTGFIFEIKRGDPRMPAFITLGEDVRREDAVVEQYFFGQGKSY